MTSVELIVGKRSCANSDELGVLGELSTEWLFPLLKTKLGTTKDWILTQNGTNCTVALVHYDKHTGRMDCKLVVLPFSGFI